MTDMTPEEARRLLEGTTPGPWEWREGKDQGGEFVALSGPDGADALRTWDGDLYASGVHGTDADKALAAAAPTLAAMIAGMREEWGVSLPDGRLVGTGWGTYDTALEDMKAWRRGGYVACIVRRYVTEPEKA
ncbi:hypothetical protein ACEE18_05760 [Corynebacterium freneyi]